MKITLDESKPIFLQISERIEDDIIQYRLKEGDQVPSTNQFAAFYQINPATAAKGIHLLHDQHIIFKKRGVGMFVAEGARATLVQKRKQQFQEDYIMNLLQEAGKINITQEEIISMIKAGFKTSENGKVDS